MPKQRESLEQLKKYPSVPALESEGRNTRAGVPSNRERPAAEVIDERTQSFWNALVDAKAAGVNQHEAEEIALPNILLKSDSEQRERVLDELEQMDAQ
jgi:hypothetical protein